MNTVPFNRLILDMQEYSAAKQVGFNVAEDVDIDYVRKTLTLALRTRVWGQRMPKSIKYPSGWWEAVKERWLPTFLLLRFPVQYVTVDAVALFPEMDIAAERGGHKVVYYFENKTLTRAVSE